MRFLPDEPIKSDAQDTLDIGEFVNLIQSSIHETETPFVYGVLGDWGSGKTSAMRLLQRKIADDLENGIKPTVPIWFNAWQYENEVNIIYPLLYAIKKDYEQRLTFREENHKFGEKFRDVVATSTLALTDTVLRVATKHFTGEAVKLDEVIQHLEKVKEQANGLDKVLSQWADQVGNIHTSFQNLLEAYAGDIAAQRLAFSEKNVRFIILVDDLDRCLPETTIAVLENIKNYLTVDRCIFVLGLNPRVVYQGIRIKYKGLEVSGQEYLEKIINYSFYVPEPELNQVADFCKEQLMELVLEDNKKHHYKNYFTEFGKIMQECNFTNPRKIKRILNRYLFFISKYEQEFSKFKNSNIVRLIILAEYYPKLFQLYLKDAETIKSELDKIGQPNFDVENFSNRFGVSLLYTYAQLMNMGGLFQLKLTTQAQGHFKLEEHVQAVFSITHFV